jgi:hypothetical protein
VATIAIYNDRSSGKLQTNRLLDNCRSAVISTLMLWLALAAQMSLPVANVRGADVRSLFSVNDFPAYVQKAGVSRTVYTRTTVRSDGTVQGCVADGKSGDPKLDVYTCGLIARRAKFRPASWMDGSPAYGVIRVPVSWIVTYHPQSYEQMLQSSIPDFEVTVSRLPEGAHQIAGANVVVAADETGHPVACAEDRPAGKTVDEHRFPELVPIACEQVMKTYTVMPVTDDSGKAVRSIQNVVVHFKLDH